MGSRTDWERRLARFAKWVLISMLVVYGIQVALALVLNYIPFATQSFPEYDIQLKWYHTRDIDWEVTPGLGYFWMAVGSGEVRIERHGEVVSIAGFDVADDLRPGTGQVIVDGDKLRIEIHWEVVCELEK